MEGLREPKLWRSKPGSAQFSDTPVISRPLELGLALYLTLTKGSQQHLKFPFSQFHLVTLSNSACDELDGPSSPCCAALKCSESYFPFSHPSARQHTLNSFLSPHQSCPTLTVSAAPGSISSSPALAEVTRDTHGHAAAATTCDPGPGCAFSPLSLRGRV